MLYCELDGYLVRNEADPVWRLKPKRDEPNVQLSELDKVGLNVVYKPCRHSCYNPKISPVTGLYYCGRKVMSRHNYPGGNTTDGCCGPNNWANCPACRTLVTEKFREIVKDGKWQGWSGLVYCGIYFGKQEEGHDGYCGPNNGPPCSKCRYLLYPNDLKLVHKIDFTNRHNCGLCLVHCGKESRIPDMMDTYRPRPPRSNCRHILHPCPYCTQSQDDPVWKGIVEFNDVIKPCIYNPKISPVTEPVISLNNYVGENITDGYCGPNTLEIFLFKSIHEKLKVAPLL